MKIMQVIPAIDLRGGQCVRLRQGDYDQETVFGDDPAAMAARWESEGAARIHLVDLDGAKAGRPVNVEAVRAILGRVDVPCQLGGGVRDEATIAAWLDAGLERVIVGTQALKDPAWFRAMAEKYPGRLVLGLDARDGRVATGGLARRLVRRGRRPWPSSSTTCRSAAVVYTDIARDGMLEGPNLAATEALAARLKTPVIASGGVGSSGGSGAPGGLADRGLHRRARPVRRSFPAQRGPGTGRRPFSRHPRRASSTRPHLTAVPSVRRSLEAVAAQPTNSKGRRDAMTTTYHIADIRNIALAGHGASGKTSLADALLFAAGATDRRGSVDDGTSLSDVDDEEKRRHFTIDCHLAPPRLGRQADPPDRLARLPRLHRQRPQRPGRRRERRR